MKAFAEISDRGNRCDVHFPYDEVTKNRVKAVTGARFIGPDKGGPLWRLPLDLNAMRALRRIFGDDLEIGNALKQWGRAAINQERRMRSLVARDDYPIEEMNLYRKLPKLAEWFRPYQRADVMILAATSAMNLLEPRLGKTTETIGATYEANLEKGFHLIVCPQKATDSIWRMEWERWTDMTVFTWTGDTKGRERTQTLVDMWKLIDRDRPFVFATTADMIRRGLPEGLELALQWNTFTIDEFHKTGLPKSDNVFPQKAAKIKAKRRYALSGTPMGGKPIKLWGALHFLYPERFTSKWNWADQWLDVDEEKVRVKGGGVRKVKKIGGIKPEKESEFYEALSPYAIRRLRTEVLPQLPPIQTIDVWCKMSATQRTQYDTFHADTEIRIDDYHLSATSVLAEYTRLKQFSNARCEVEILGIDEETGHIDMKVKPTIDSGKLPYLMERLAEAGIDPEEPEGTEQAIVTSQFRETADMLYDYLTKQGIKCARLTGKSSKRESELAQRVFKSENDSDGYRVCVMVTTLGVGITLDNVQTVHVFDETWVPDDQDQLIDRAVNTTKNHQVTAFYYRSQDSVEEYIGDITFEKDRINKKVLDEQRKKMKEKLGR